MHDESIYTVVIETCTSVNNNIHRCLVVVLHITHLCACEYDLCIHIPVASYDCIHIPVASYNYIGSNFLM